MGRGAIMELFAGSKARADFDQESWRSFLNLVPHLVATCTACWGLLHLLLSRSVKAESFGITKAKEKVCVHNNMISTTHAIFSFCAGVVYFAQGWGREAASEVFCFSQFFHLVTAVSVGYILYDFVFLAIYFEYMKNQLATILAHHAIFIFTYFLSQVSSLNQGPPAPAPFRPSLLSRTLTRPAFPPCLSLYLSICPPGDPSQYVPCTLGMILYFWFSLTEVSTPFLNYNWFLMKANFSKELWKKNGYVLLLTFGIRWIITVSSLPFLWWYYREHVQTGKIYDQVAPKFWWLVDGYLFFFALGVGGLLFLNTYWYYVLLRKAYNAVASKPKKS